MLKEHAHNYSPLCKATSGLWPKLINGVGGRGEENSSEVIIITLLCCLSHWHGAEFTINQSGTLRTHDGQITLKLEEARFPPIVHLSRVPRSCWEAKVRNWMISMIKTPVCTHDYLFTLFLTPPSPISRIAWINLLLCGQMRPIGLKCRLYLNFK